MKMKLQATKKEIKRAYAGHLVKVGYCKLQHLLYEGDAFAYSAGVYGWRCDYHIINSNGGAEICISTGYDPIGEKILSDEELKKFDDKARAIKCDASLSYDKAKTKIERLKRELATLISQKIVLKRKDETLKNIKNIQIKKLSEKFENWKQ